MDYYATIRYLKVAAFVEKPGLDLGFYSDDRLDFYSLLVPADFSTWGVELRNRALYIRGIALDETSYRLSGMRMLTWTL